MNVTTIRDAILSGDTCLGMEFGSTRIKAILIDGTHRVIASGAVQWENRLEDGIWTYDLCDAVSKMQACYGALKADVEEKYGVALRQIGQICISGMMHGLLALDENGEPVTRFRTWRNTMTEEESEILSELFGMTIPQRWSAAHLCQLMRTEPQTAARIRRMTTLSGYIHWLLTGEFVLGCCDAGGMLPIDVFAEPLCYYPHMTEHLDRLAREAGMPWTLLQIFPRILRAGDAAGVLTADGAALLDPTGALCAGIPFCPPEGDGGTGMVCTGGLAPGNGTVSAGTSTFALFVLDAPLMSTDRRLEPAVTPGGRPAVQIHGSNGTSEIDGFVSMLADGMKRLGLPVEMEEIYAMLLGSAVEGGGDAGEILAYNFLSGEHLVGLSAGRPMYVRTPQSRLTLNGFMRAQLFAVFAPLMYGFSLLHDEVRGKIRSVRAHGGLFRTRGTVQRVLASAMGVPVTVSAEAGEGGAFGAALLAAYAEHRADGETLEAYLARCVFVGECAATEEPDPVLAEEYRVYLERWMAGLPVEATAVQTLITQNS